METVKPAFPVRQAVARLIGPEILAYLLHLRPMEWPIMTAHFLLGTLMAAGWGAFRTHGGATLLGWFVFVALLNGGTLAINSAFDQDEGDIGYLRNPPKPPRHLFAVSMAMLVASAALGFLLPRTFAWSNAACVVMAILYSVPPARLKARAGWDLLINCLGFGLLTPLAGWGVTGLPVPTSFVWIIWGFACLFGTLYPLTQIYQIEEDTARGDQTLVIRLGVRGGLILAILLALGAHACFIMAAPARFLWVMPSLVAWLLLLVPWCARWQSWSASRAEAGMYWGLAAWALTDVSLLVSLWPA